MKKIILNLALLGSIAFANNIKDNNYFASVDIGNLKVHDSDMVYGVSFGYYFYDPNIYQINNRIYLDFKKVDSDANFDIFSLKLDWIKNTSTPFAPFLGVNIGYLYFKDNGLDYSTGVYGGELGLIYEVNYNISGSVEFVYQTAFDKQDVWNTGIKTFKVGLEYSF